MLTKTLPKGTTVTDPIDVTRLDGGVYVTRILYQNGDVRTVKLTKM